MNEPKETQQNLKEESESIKLERDKLYDYLDSLDSPDNFFRVFSYEEMEE